MGLETGTYIDDLVETNPLGSDQRSTADDHLRLIKSVLKATLTNADYALDLALLSGLSSNVQTQLNAITAQRKQSLAYNGVLAQHHNLTITNNTTNPNYQVDIAAEGLILSNTTGLQLKFENLASTVDITASGVNGLDTGSEATSTWYHLWMIANDTAISSGTTTSTTANKLVDTSANFSTDGVKAGDIVFNTTDLTTARITAIDAATQLSLSADIFASGETYEIFAVAGLLSTSATAPTMPSGYTYKGYVGAIYNNSFGHFQKMYQMDTKATVTPTSDLNTGTATSYTSVSLQIPPAAKKWSGMMEVIADGTGNTSAYIASRDILIGPFHYYLGEKKYTAKHGSASYAAQVPVNLTICESQTLYYMLNVGASVSLFTTEWEY